MGRRKRTIGRENKPVERRKRTREEKRVRKPIDEREYYRLRKLGIKKEDISARLGLSRSVLSRWEKGQFGEVKPRVRREIKPIDRCKWLADYYMLFDDLWEEDDLEAQRLEACLRKHGLGWEDWYDYREDYKTSNT